MTLNSEYFKDRQAVNTGNDKIGKVGNKADRNDASNNIMVNNETDILTTNLMQRICSDAIIKSRAV